MTGPQFSTLLTRRRLLATGGVGLAGLAAAACGADASPDTPAPSGPAPSSGAAAASPSAAATAQDQSDTEKLVQFSNWPQYIDEDEGEGSTLQDFTASTGIEVEYTDDINDSNEFYAKVRTSLEQGRSIDRDIVVLTEEGVELWIANGFAAPLDKANIPNAVNLIPALQNVPFDPGRTYSLPWQSGFTGIGWNSKLLERELGVKKLTSFDQFFDPRLKGRVTVLVEMPDTMGLLMNWLGFNMANFTEADFDETLSTLQQKIDEGFIRQVTGNDYIAALDSGDAIASIGWSGDVLALGKKYGFAIPDSGGMIWADNMLIPSVATHKANAERLMDYYYDPEVAARVAAWVAYVCPVEGAQEAMAKVDPDLVDDKWIFPTPELLSTAQEFMSLGPDAREAYNRKFLTTVGA